MDKRTEGRRIAFFAILAPCLLLLLAAECSQEEAPKKPVGTVIARVGNAVLTLEELQESIPDEYSYVITRDQNIQYIRQWMNTELLYKEALRLNIDQEPEIKARLEKMKKDLLSAEIISRSVARGGTEINEQAIREFYESNRDQFVREYNVVRFDEIVVDDLNLAWEIRRTATHESFKNLAKTHSRIPVVGESTPYVPLDAIPPVIRNAVQTAAIPSITGPYRAEDGFYIIRLIGRFDRGTIASLEEVRAEVIARLSTVTLKSETERLIEDIRSRSDVEFNTGLVPGADVAAAEAAEVEAQD
jgi:hypothetical protein